MSEDKEESKEKGQGKTSGSEAEERAELRTLANLHPAKGSNHPIKRLGRGPGSGLGKTAGKGHKGLKARKGGKVRPGFEGGQMPLYMRLPKRGFRNKFSSLFNSINLDQLARFEDGAEIDPQKLEGAGLLRYKNSPVKLLARGKLEKRFSISVHKASASAKIAIEKAGGTLNLISPPAAKGKPDAN